MAHRDGRPYGNDTKRALMDQARRYGWRGQSFAKAVGFVQAIARANDGAIGPGRLKAAWQAYRGHGYKARGAARKLAYSLRLKDAGLVASSAAATVDSGKR